METWHLEDKAAAVAFLGAAVARILAGDAALKDGNQPCGREVAAVVGDACRRGWSADVYAALVTELKTAAKTAADIQGDVLEEVAALWPSWRRRLGELDVAFATLDAVHCGVLCGNQSSRIDAFRRHFLDARRG